jgi:hypothetical protein
MKREDWNCPRCTQTCSRHYNWKVHIYRRHPDLSRGRYTQQQNNAIPVQTELEVEAFSIPHREGNIANLANASNVDLMSWVLTQNCLVHQADIDNWISIFESNEAHVERQKMAIRKSREHKWVMEKNRIAIDNNRSSGFTRTC